MDLYQYQKGDTVLIPAAMDYYVISGKASILEIYFIVGNRKIICTFARKKIKKKNGKY
jgi:hypothetical protein